MKAGVEPARGRDLSGLRAVGSTGSPLSPEGFDWIYEHVGARHLALLDQRRHRPLHRLRRRRPAPARLPRRAAGAGAGRRRGGLGRGRQGGHRRGRRARRHRADALDAALPLGRRGRQPLPGQLLRAVPRRLAPRRLDRDHLARHRGDLRPLGLDDQPRRASGWGRARSTAPSRPSPRSRRPRRRHPPARDRGLDAALRRPPRGRRARRRPAREIKRAHPRAVLAPPRPQRDLRRSPRCRAPSAARCSRCR